MTIHAWSGLPDPHDRADFYASVLPKRGFAWVADSILIALLAAIALPFTAFTGIFFFPFLMAVIGFFYRWFTIAGGSSTWGMRLMGIELRGADGLRLTSQDALLHTAGYTVSVVVFPLQLISVLMMLMSPRRQGLSDLVLGTAAINRMG
jgi:uncharacterized RDD family membrane protein YckC